MSLVMATKAACLPGTGAMPCLRSLLRRRRAAIGWLGARLGNSSGLRAIRASGVRGLRRVGGLLDGDGGQWRW